MNKNGFDAVAPAAPAKLPETGTRWRHRKKGGEYFVTMITNTGGEHDRPEQAPQVVYQEFELTEDKRAREARFKPYWSRPLSEWREKMEEIPEAEQTQFAPLYPLENKK